MVALRHAPVAPRHRLAARRLAAGESVAVPTWGLPAEHALWHVVRARLGAIAAGAAEPEAVYAGALADLERWGASRQRRRRRDSRVDLDPALDSACAEVWRRVFDQPDQGSLQALERRHARTIGRVIGIVAGWRAGGGGDALRRRIRALLWRGFLPALAASWRDVALRVVLYEQVPAMPALVALADEDALGRMTTCIAGRRGWGGTVRALSPGVAHLPAQEGRWARALQDDPSIVVRWVDAHLVLRLVETWPARAGGAGTGLAVMDDNEARALARLRAALARGGSSPHLRQLLLGSAGLHCRTDAALFAYTHAWAERAVLEQGEAASPSPPCEVQAPPALDPATRAALDAWLLRVVLAGRVADLQAWLWARAPRSGRFWTLLQDAPGPLRADRYRPLRRALSRDLDRSLAALCAPLRAMLEEPAASDLSPQARRAAAAFLDQHPGRLPDVG